MQSATSTTVLAGLGLAYNTYWYEVLYSCWFYDMLCSLIILRKGQL